MKFRKVLTQETEREADVKGYGCEVQDNAQCTGGAVDNCWEDYAACSGSGPIDVCFVDYAACSTQAEDYCQTDNDTCHHGAIDGDW